MQWFKHYNDARTNPKFRAVEKQLGEAGYARAFKLFEIVAKRGGTAENFTPLLDLKNAYTSIDWLADELRISVEEAERTLEVLALARLIDPKAFRKRLIRIPQMLEYLDEWTRKKLRAKNSEVTPERLQSDSGPTPAQSKSKRTEKEADEEKRKEIVATTAARLLEKTKEESWREIEARPCGSAEFQNGWERMYGERPDSEELSNTMERYIQACGGAGISVPRPFYKAKRRVENRELKQQLESYPDEVSRIAGPRGVPEELMR
jgi:hypothetical protein